MVADMTHRRRSTPAIHEPSIHPVLVPFPIGVPAGGTGGFPGRIAVVTEQLPTGQRRIRGFRRIVPALATALILSGCGITGPAHRSPPAGTAATVTMGFESFSPSTVTVRVGDSVAWQNTSLITHTVTADPARAQDPKDVELPRGAAPFDSGDIPAGEIYRHIFNEPGTYRYFCTRHEKSGMVATVVVVPTP